MKIRNQLIHAFVLLAVLPLSGLVVYSYSSSRQAVQEALAAEASAMSAELRGRLEAVRNDLERGMLRLAWMAEPGAAGEWTPRERAKILLEDLGESAKLFEAFEVIPMVGAEQGEMEESEADEVGVLDPVVHLLEEHLSQLQGKQETAEAEEIWHLTAEMIAKSLAETFEQDVEIYVIDDVAQPSPRPPTPRAAPEPVQPSFPSSPATPAVVEPKLPPETAAIWRAAEGRGEAARMRLLEESRRRAEEKEERLRASRQSTRMLFGRDLELPLLQGNAEVGRLRARVRADALVQEVLARTLGEQGEVPFALDSEGKLHTLKEEDSSLLEQFPLADLSSQHPTLHTKHWVVATTEDEQSGMRFGIARPIDKDVASISLAAARNFAMGLALIVLAILGILPFSNRITRNLHLVIAGAERIAAGDLTARVPVRTRDEFGQLASTFNSMAQQLSENQERLLEEERRRLLLAAENDRKSRELEGARELQLSLLPRTLPTHPSFELAVHMRTATEVGGDYYDFQLHQDGTLVMAIGDATGHGLRAGTLVTAIKSLFANYHPSTGPDHFLTNASATLRRLDLGRLAMALTLVELRGDDLTVAAGGIPPLLIHRAQRGTVEEFLYPGLPLGVPLPFVYQSHHVCLSPGDTLLLTTDGFAELLNPKGDLLGYDRVRDLFREAVEGGGPQAVIDHLEKSLDRWTEGEPPADDVTFVVLQSHPGLTP